MPKVIALSGHIGFEITASFVRKELIAAKRKPVKVDLNSAGGFVFEGIEIFNLIDEYEGEVEVRLMALAASMGSYIALAGDRVTAFDNATFMIHNALTIASGNHNDFRKTANRLEGISNILARKFSDKSGKSLSEIKQMMDDETFLFGNEMLDAGFVDEIIESESDSKNKDDRDSAIIEARLSVEGCFNKMRESEAAKADLEKAAAYLDLNDKQLCPSVWQGLDLNKNNIIPIINKTNKNKEVTKMTLKEFLAENPSANIEFEKAIIDARAEGAKEKKDEVQANLNKMAPIIASETYPAAIRNLASEVLQGKEDYSALKGAVTMYDASEEKRKSDEVSAEAKRLLETKPGSDGGGNVSEDGTISNEDEYQAGIERMKKGVI